MLRKVDGRLEGPFPAYSDYYRSKGVLARAIMPITKWLRAIQAEKFMAARDTHLDIGCGDGYFIKRSKCRSCYGLDSLYGDNFDSQLNFADDFFDYVTMLAVVEHLPNLEGAIREIHRVLKPGGKFIFTTPKKSAEWLITLYAREAKEEHLEYFDLESIKHLSQRLFRVESYQTFCLGLNQLFCLLKG